MIIDESRLDHLMWEEDGWGYLPNQSDVMYILKNVIYRTRPESLLEIGFYAGHSTSYWAELFPGLDITSCCPPHPRGLKYGPIVADKYPNVTFIPIKSPEVLIDIHQFTYDLIFIDGNHTSEAVWADTTLAYAVDAKYILYDNSDQVGVRPEIDKMVEAGMYEIVGEYEYFSHFKGVAKNNGMTLVKINRK